MELREQSEIDVWNATFGAAFAAEFQRRVMLFTENKGPGMGGFTLSDVILTRFSIAEYAIAVADNAVLATREVIMNQAKVPT